jgi:predicted CoA-binding protein
MKRVVVLGATPKKDRYANMAVRLLVEHGHTVVPVNPAFDAIEGLTVAKTLSDISGDIDTITLYVGEQRSLLMKDERAKLSPKRVIFNPRTESPELEQFLRSKGIETVKGCTLVMLRTGVF